MRLALAQINTVVGDIPGNEEKTLRAVGEAKAAGAQLVVFPELSVTGYPPEDLLLKEHFLAAARESLDRIASAVSGIVAIVAVLVRALSNFRCKDVMHSGLWLLRVSLLVAGLTAAQWLPAWHWLQHSQRAPRQPSQDQTIAVPSDLVLGGDLASDVSDDMPALFKALGERPRSVSVARSRSSTYDYSIAPWHLGTLIWSTAGGHFLPVHSRWLQALAAEPRMWIPSLAIGLVPILLVVASWFSGAARRPQRFLIVVALISAAAMFGNFAPVWGLRQVCHWLGAEAWARSLPGDEVGGATWIFTQLVPGYAAFRYPAKWSVWFACALALCAGHGLSRISEGRVMLRRLSIVITAASAIGLAAVCILLWTPLGLPGWNTLTKWLAAAESDPWLGRPMPAAVVRVWLSSLAVGLTVAGACAISLRWHERPARLKAALVLLTVLELFYAANTWVVTVSPTVAAPSVTALDDATQRKVHSEPFVRTWANIGRADFVRDLPFAENQLARSDAQRRVQYLCAYQAAFQLGKLHLLVPQRANLAALMSLTPHSLAVVRSRLAQADDLRLENPRLDEALAWLGVAYRLTDRPPLRWQAVPNARPIVECRSRHAHGERLQIEHFGADRIRLRVDCERPTELVVRVLQDGGWSARLLSVDDGGANGAVDSVVDSAVGDTSGNRSFARVSASAAGAGRSVKPALSHLGLFQTLAVPAGKWLVVLDYTAPGLRLGCALSGLTLGVSLFYLFLWSPWVGRGFSVGAKRASSEVEQA